MMKYNNYISVLLIATISFCVFTGARAQSYNYIKSIAPLSASTDIPNANTASCQIITNYYDGLGREMCSVRKGYCGDGNPDLASLVTYDELGRQDIQFLPTPVNDNDEGGFLEGFYLKARNAYDGDVYPYNQIVYDGKDENRVSEKWRAGEPWHTNSKKVKKYYTFNSYYDYLDDWENDFEIITYCDYYSIDNNNNLIKGYQHEAGSFKIDITLDEDGKCNAVFLDKMGRKVLQRQGDGYYTADTYYVYDLCGRLTYVIPPQASLEFVEGSPCDTTIINKLCYKYTYDDYDRVIEKKLPGAAPIYYVYDRLNRPVLSQNGVQRNSREWSVEAYDNQMRLALEGKCIMPSSFDRESLQAIADSLSVTAVYNTALSMESTLCYSWPGFPASNFTPYRAYYYDDYTHWNSLIPISLASGLPTMISENGKGYNTGTAVTDFSGSVTVTATIYDERGNVEASYERDLYGQDCAVAIENTYDWSNQIIAKKRVTSRLLEQTLFKGYTEWLEYDYDNWGHLTCIRHKLNNGGWNEIAAYGYNTLGQVASETLNNNFAMSYNYNLCGWITSVNSQLFNMTIYHQESTDNNTPCYNGNISQITETRRSNGMNADSKTRLIFYDSFNRVDSVIDEESSLFNVHYVYDLNGNVTVVNRGSNGLFYDQISINYDGNHVVDIIDNSLADDYMGEIPQLAMGNYLESVGYDACGRIISDASRGVSSVLYNPLHLPQIIRFETGDLIVTSYRADGVKTSVNTKHRYTEAVKRYDRVTGDTIIVNVNRLKSVTRRYTGNLMEESGKADRLYNEVGYVDISNDGSYSYHYYIKDIWGSIRAVIDENGCIEQADDYTDSGIPYNANQLYAVDNRKHAGKEFEAFDGLAWYDNNARWYDPILVRFITMDPKAENYYNLTPYNYCAGNPVNLMDPNGEEIIGKSYIDACLFSQDLYQIMCSSLKLMQFWCSLDISKDTYSFNEIPEAVFVKSIEGMSKDEEAFVTLLYKTINSDCKHYVSYYTDVLNDPNAIAQFLSKLNRNDQIDLFKYDQVVRDGYISQRILEDYGGAITYQDKGATYSHIGINMDFRCIFGCHEVLGHGRALEFDDLQTDQEQQIPVIQLNNLLLRLTYNDFIDDGTNHGPKTKVEKCKDLPILLLR